MGRGLEYLLGCARSESGYGVIIVLSASVIGLE